MSALRNSYFGERFRISSAGAAGGFARGGSATSARPHWLLGGTRNPRGIGRWPLMALWVFLALLLPLGAHASWDVGEAQVAHWGMDDNATTSTVVDLCGEHPGVFNDASGNPQTNAHAAVGRVLGALGFDGNDDLISIPDADDLDSSASFSLSLWAQSDAPDRQMPLVSKMDMAAPGSGWQLEWRGSARKWAVIAGRSGAPSTVYLFPGTLDGQWRNLVVLYDGAAAAGARWSLYANGVGVAPDSIQSDEGGALIANDQAFLIGAALSSGAFTNFFRGRLDEVRLFNRALTGEEVSGLYNRGVGTDKSASSELMAPPTMTGVAVTDRDGRNNADAALYTNDPLVFVFLRGIGGEVDAAHLAESEDMMANPQDFWRPPLGSWDGGTTLSFRLSSEEGLRSVWAMLSNQSGVSYPPMSATITLDTIPPSVKLESETPAETEDYSIPVRVTLSEPIPDFNAGKIAIGGVGGAIERFEAAETTCTFQLVPKGAAEVTLQVLSGAIHDRAGNPNMVSNVLRRKIASEAPWLKAHLALDETTGTIAADSSRYRHDGALENGLAFEANSRPGVLGQALRFDGVNSYISLPALNLNANEATLAAWIKREGNLAPFTGVIFSADGGTTAGLRVGTHNELRYAWKSDSQTQDWDSGLVVPDGQWVFVALVIEPEKATLYMGTHGDLKSASNAAHHEVEAFDGAARIGRGASDEFFVGLMDDIQVFSKAMSPEAIGQMAAAGPAVTPPAFVRDPLVKPDAVVAWVYRQSLREDVRAMPQNRALVFAKESGPAWLAVGADGGIRGIPGTANLGMNEFRVQVRDSWGTAAEAMLRIQVLPDGSTVSGSSATSPAWVECDLASTSQTARVAIAGAAPVRLVMESATRFYADNASVAADGSPTSNSLGVLLSPEAPVNVSLAAGDGITTQSASRVISWTPTDLAGCGAAAEPILIRAGDGLLLTATGAGTLLEIDANGDGAFEHVGAPESKFPAFYPVAGEYTAIARIDGLNIGALRVVALGVNFDGPIACQLDFRRDKQVFVTPEAFAGRASFAAAAPAALEVRKDGGTSSLLKIKPLQTGKPILQARISDGNGPVIGKMPVDAFRFSASALLQTEMCTIYCDGSLDLKAALEMQPVVADLYIVLESISPDLTFEDSGLTKIISTDDFDSTGHCSYHMIKLGHDQYGPCHTSKILQKNILVGQ